MAAPLSGSPPYFLDEPPRAVLQLNGSGPNVARQGSSHPNQVVAVPGRNEILVPDLGSDQTWRCAYDNQQGVLSLRGSVTYPPGSGPRHAVFHSPSFSFTTSLHPFTALIAYLWCSCIHTYR